LSNRIYKKKRNKKRYGNIFHVIIPGVCDVEVNLEESNVYSYVKASCLKSLFNPAFNITYGIVVPFLLSLTKLQKTFYPVNYILYS